MTTELVSAKPYALFFQALSNPARMQIVNLLREKRRSLSVTEICMELNLEQTHVSHALRCLTFCGLVEFARDGKSKLYSLNKATVVPLLRIVDDHLEKFAGNLYTCEVLKR
ncbi:MAG: metalloregulator ArsR/SmtB family transcription factor [archaeon]|nr:metalloregulator ArsR/SmtB family transcription factor [archaeon]